MQFCARLMSLVIVMAALAACQTGQRAPDPLDYLKAGVDPTEDSATSIANLETQGYEVSQTVEGGRYVAFSAVRGEQSLVRVVTTRGAALWLEAPDGRVPNRTGVGLQRWPRLDFDSDGEADVLVTLSETLAVDGGERRCLGWIQVDSEGFLREVFRLPTGWGEQPCVREIAVNGRELSVEVTVPNSGDERARISLPVVRQGDRWELDTPRIKPLPADRGASADDRYLVACEVAWIRRLQGATPDQQEAAFWESMGGTGLSPSLRAQARHFTHSLYDPDEPIIIEPGVPDSPTVLEPAPDGEEARR